MGKDIMHKLRKYNLDPEIFRAYGLEITDISPVRGTFRIDTEQGPLYFKETYNDEAKMLFIASAMEHLRHNGFPWIPRFIPTLDGDLFLVYKEKVYFISEWIEGRECNFERSRELLMAVKTLARMHEASKGFEPPPGCRIKTEWGKLPEKLHKQTLELIKFKEMAEEKEEKTEFDLLYLDNVQDFIRMAEHSLELLEASDYFTLVEKAMEEKGFCHCDYTYHNVMIVGEKRYYVIDFDYCRFEIPVYDLVKMMRRALSRLNWSVDAAVSMVQAYHRIIPLSEEERHVLLSLLWYPQKFWRHVERYYHQKRQIDEEEYVKDLEKLIKQRKKVKKFLKEFSARVLDESTGN